MEQQIMSSFKELTPNKKVLRGRKNGKSKGQIFKETYGFSKTLVRNMKRNGLNPFVDNSIRVLEEYRAIRKARKKAALKIKQERHTKSVAYKRANGKKKGAKNNQPKKKEETKK